jgi:hypothetical protein
MKINLSVLTCVLSLVLAQSAQANDALTEVGAAFKKLDTLKGYRVTMTTESQFAMDKKTAEMAEKNPEMLAKLKAPIITEYANPGPISRSIKTQPRLTGGQYPFPALKTTTITAGKVTATMQEYASEEDRLLAEKIKQNNAAQSGSISVGSVGGLVQDPLGGLGGILFSGLASQLAQQFQGQSFYDQVGKWTCRASQERENLTPAEARKFFSAARKLGNSTVKNESTVQYETKSMESSMEVTQVIDISVRSGLPLRTVVNFGSKEMGQGKTTLDYYDFDSPIKIEMPTCS